MKQCKKCGEVKSSDEFTVQARNKKYSGGIRLNARCKPCMNDQANDYRRKMSELVRRWRRRKGCARCGHTDPYGVSLHCAHRDKDTKSNKKGGHAIKNWWSKNRVKEELAKCDVLCANCHAIDTYENKDYKNQTHRD